MAEDREVSPTRSTAMNVVTQLQEFRQAIYKNLCKAQDATFELMDALLLTRKAQSLADLSFSCVFRRQWPSAYEALQDTRPDRVWRLYLRRFAIDHWYRFAKNRHSYNCSNFIAGRFEMFC